MVLKHRVHHMPPFWIPNKYIAVIISPVDRYRSRAYIAELLKVRDAIGVNETAASFGPWTC